MTGPAFGHAVLIASEPADGAVLSHAPSRVTLTFNEPVTPVILRVVDAQGRAIALAGPPTASDRTVTAVLPPDLGDGSYVVSFRVISLDSHPVGRSLVFTVGAGAPAAPKEANGSSWDRFYPVLRWLAVTALSLAIGGAVFRAYLLPEAAAATDAVAARIAKAAAILGILAAMLAAGMRGIGLADLPLTGLATLAPWQLVLRTSLAPSLLLIACAVLLVLLGPRHKLLATLALVAFAAALAVTSHAALASPVIVSFPAFAIHVAVAAFWLASLPLLMVALAREAVATVQPVIVRFSRGAAWGIAAMLLAGVVLTLSQTGPDLSIWTGRAWAMSSYAPLLAAKVTLAAVVVGIAIRNKLMLTPLLTQTPAVGSARLSRSIAVEAAVMLVIVALAAALGSSIPPRSFAASPAEESSAGEEALGAFADANRDGVDIMLKVEPARPGANELIVHFFDQAKGVHLAPKEVAVEAALPASGIEPIRRLAVARGDGTYRVSAMPIAAPGLWIFNVEALLTDFDKLTVTMKAQIRPQRP